MKKTILVTGVSGQDGANMCEYLLGNKKHEVYGMVRRSSSPNFKNCQNFLTNSNFNLVYGDLSDEVSICKLVEEIQPDYFINFAANSFVGCSWDMPMQVFDANALGVLRCLEAIKKHQPKCKFYSAGSSEEFGDVDYSPQDEKHPLKPRSPYGASKCAARHLVKVYRESYGLYAVHGTLFNHEGTKRGEEFVTRKITKGVARIYHEMRSADKWKSRHGSKPVFDPIELGNLDAKRDWSDSEDFVKGIWLMLNQKEPKDYLLASGETHSIREFVEKAFEYVKMNGEWEGEDLKEKYVYHAGNFRHILVKINPDFYRPNEVELLMGDPRTSQKELKWIPEVSFCDLVKKMVLNDVHEAMLAIKN